MQVSKNPTSYQSELLKILKKIDELTIFSLTSRPSLRQDVNIFRCEDFKFIRDLSKLKNHQGKHHIESAKRHIEFNKSSPI